MNDHWFVITGWNDDQGRRKRRAEHWADSTQFSPTELLASPDDTKAKVLSHVYTLDLPTACATERIQHLITTDKEKVIKAVLLHMVPTTSGEDRWVDHDVAKTREKPAESERTLVTAAYGVSVYRLATPIDILDEKHSATKRSS
jgi:hypothetical protein